MYSSTETFSEITTEKYYFGKLYRKFKKLHDRLIILRHEIHQNYINPFSTNVPLPDKPGSWFLLAKCLKNTSGRVTI